MKSQLGKATAAGHLGDGGGAAAAHFFSSFFRRAVGERQRPVR